MVLSVDYESREYKFYKTLHEDVKLISDEYGEWDLSFTDGDWENVNGKESIRNACIIAIMTRYDELDITLYEEFGCRIHELIKQNKSRQVIYRMELYITETLEKMRRIKTVNWIEIIDDTYKYYNYRVNFSITCINDEGLEEVVEETVRI